VHGRWPSPSSGALYEGRDLALTTDFRDLLAELLARHLGAGDPHASSLATVTASAPGVLRA
jgi:uncharacterized protein (DUF1501 family)